MIRRLGPKAEEKVKREDVGALLKRLEALEAEMREIKEKLQAAL